MDHASVFRCVYVNQIFIAVNIMKNCFPPCELVVQCVCHGYLSVMFVVDSYLLEMPQD